MPKQTPEEPSEDPQDSSNHEEPLRTSESFENYTRVLPIVSIEVVDSLAKVQSLDFGAPDPHKTAIMPGIVPRLNRLGSDIADMHHNYAVEYTRQMHLRHSFADLTPSQRDQLEPYLRICANRIYADSSKELPAATAKSWSEWLGYEAGVAELQAFSDMHSTLLHDQAVSSDLSEVFTVEQNKFIQMVPAWVGKGRFSPYALTNISQMQRVRPLLGDMWDTVLRNRDAHHVLGSGEVVFRTELIGEDGIAQPVSDEVRRKNIRHELDHTANGRHMPVVFMEAIAEHIAVNTADKIPDELFEVLDPRQRPEVNSSYRGYRRLTHVLATEGDRAIPVKVWTLAHTSSGIESQEYRDFSELFVVAWDTTPQEISEAVLTYESKLTEQEKRRVATDSSHRALNVNQIEKRAVNFVIRDLRKARNERRIQQQTGVLGAIRKAIRNVRENI